MNHKQFMKRKKKKRDKTTKNRAYEKAKQAQKPTTCVNSERRKMRTRTRNQSNTIRTHKQKKKNIRIVEANRNGAEIYYVYFGYIWLGFTNMLHTAILDVFSTHNIYRSIQFLNTIRTGTMPKTIIEPTRMK